RPDQTRIRPAADPDGTRGTTGAPREPEEFAVWPRQRGRQQRAGSPGAHLAPQAELRHRADGARIRLHDSAGAEVKLASLHGRLRWLIILVLAAVLLPLGLLSIHRT